MFSKTLVKLVDEAILPAVTLVAVKVISAIMVSEALGLKWSWREFGLVYYSTADFLKANSYSALVMFGMMLFFTGWVIIKAHVLHDSHITPGASVRLVSFNLPHLIQSSFEIYSQATVWLSYSWLTTILLGVLSFSGLIFPWVFFVAFGLTFVTSVLMILDLEREIKINKEDFLEPSSSYV